MHTALKAQDYSGSVTWGDGEHGRKRRLQLKVRHVAAGLTNPQISRRHGIGLSTVNHHVHNILDKLGARTRTEAVAIAVREGLVDL
jgi:DNA-binding NarL/FixJ family response regulator